jgi:hypothetical protein
MARTKFEVFYCLETRIDTSPHLTPGYNSMFGRKTGRVLNIGSTWFVSELFPEIETTCTGVSHGVRVYFWGPRDVMGSRDVMDGIEITKITNELCLDNIITNVFGMAKKPALIIVNHQNKNTAG